MAYGQSAKDTIQDQWFGSLPTASIDMLMDNLKALIGEVKFALIAGGAAGAHTVTGIATDDQLVMVLHLVGAGTDITDIDDLTGEFSISAVDTIDNTSGTSTTGDKMLVVYLDLS